MSIEKLRGLSKFGVLTDPDPYDLPPEAFTAGVNVRFRNGHITAGPVFRNVFHLGTTDPRFTCSFSPTSNSTELFIGYKNGTVTKFSAGAESAYSPAGYVTSAVEAPWTATTLAGVVYINRGDRGPWALRPSDATFVTLSSLGSASPVGWDSTWVCNLLRTCSGALVALNVTKGATNYPNLVKTSSNALAGAVPASWDQTSSTTNATENTLSKMDGPITDACPLGTNLVIYGLREAWLMSADGSTFIYRYDKLPFKKGSLNANCAVELAGKNYVFGVDDIWVHDGNSETSLVDKKNRDFIFSTINMSQFARCYVYYNPKYNEMHFCYVSGDPYVAFLSGINGCNRAAIYNLTDGTWTFDDKPSTFMEANTTISNALTYATVTATYSTIGGTYQDQEDGLKRTTVAVGESSTTYNLSTSLYAIDPYGAGSSVAYAVDTNATPPRYLERIGLDLVQLGAEIAGYKTLSTLWPQARLGLNASNLMIAVGASDQINSANPVYSAYQPYDGNLNYKLDFNVAGRWLSYKILFADYRELTITGFDFNLKTTGHF